MPLAFQISRKLELVYTRWWGEVSISEWPPVFRCYLRHALYRPGRTELTDFTDMTAGEADFNSLWAALNMVNRALPADAPRTRTVLIAPGEVVYGLARIYQSLAENSDGIRVEIHRSRVAAIAALGLSYRTLAELLDDGDFSRPEPSHSREEGFETAAQ